MGPENAVRVREPENWAVGIESPRQKPWPPFGDLRTIEDSTGHLPS